MYFCFRLFRLLLLQPVSSSALVCGHFVIYGLDFYYACYVCTYDSQRLMYVKLKALSQYLTRSYLLKDEDPLICVVYLAILC